MFKQAFIVYLTCNFLPQQQKQIKICQRRLCSMHLSANSNSNMYEKHSHGKQWTKISFVSTNFISSMLTIRMISKKKRKIKTDCWRFRWWNWIRFFWISSNEMKIRKNGRKDNRNCVWSLCRWHRFVENSRVDQSIQLKQNFEITKENDMKWMRSSNLCKFCRGKCKWKRDKKRMTRRQLMSVRSWKFNVTLCSFYFISFGFFYPWLLTSTFSVSFFFPHSFSHRRKNSVFPMQNEAIVTQTIKFLHQTRANWNELHR